MSTITKGTILLVDDHKMIINGLISLFSDKFDRIETAYKGEEAIQIAETILPELVILDYR